MSAPHPSRRFLVGSIVSLLVILLGVVIFLATVVHIFGVHSVDVLALNEVASFEGRKVRPYGTEAIALGEDEVVERIPRILHQTWKEEVLPERWQLVSDRCRAMHPDYEYMLWTDAASREFIASNYPTFLSTYDGYPYSIQRADAIRYFILHHYGGVYLDLDVGCSRPVDSLLNFDVILPRTHPVGISNDVIFAAPRHPFMESAIHSLAAFDHSLFTKYATVMFSTGPMFLSAIYGASPRRIAGTRDGVRVLPRELYGKYAKEGEGERAFFAHYFGSSWHGDDAGLVKFLDHFGLIILYIIAGIALIATARLCYTTLTGRLAYTHARRSSLLPVTASEKPSSLGKLEIPSSSSLWFKRSPASHAYEPLPVDSPGSAAPWRPSTPMYSPPLTTAKALELDVHGTFEKHD